MNKFICFILSTSMLSAFAQENPTALPPPPPKPDGWQNWAFTGTALAVATSAVLFIAFNNGHDAPRPPPAK